MRLSPKPVAGFTLLELLLAIVIAGIALGVVSLNVSGNEKRGVRNEAERIALLLAAARDEAILRNRPVAFDADVRGYRFWVSEDIGWQLLTQDEVLRQRAFRSGVQTSLSPAAADGRTRIVFGREPIASPFVLTLQSDEASAMVRADGSGRFVVD